MPRQLTTDERTKILSFMADPSNETEELHTFLADLRIPRGHWIRLPLRHDLNKITIRLLKEQGWEFTKIELRGTHGR